MPFGGNLGVVFEACVKRFLLEKSGAKEGELKFVRGDEVRRPGVIICEGICKRIQEADFVTADITLPNPNVFYELGLSYRIHRKNCSSSGRNHPMDRPNPFSEWAARKLEEGGCSVYDYANLEGFKAENIPAKNLFWRDISEYSHHDTGDIKTNIVFFEAMFPDGNEEKIGIGSDNFPEYSMDIELLFREHAISHVIGAVEDLEKELRSRNGKTDESGVILDEYTNNIIGKALKEITVCNAFRKIQRDKNKI